MGWLPMRFSYAERQNEHQMPLQVTETSPASNVYDCQPASGRNLIAGQAGRVVMTKDYQQVCWGQSNGDRWPAKWHNNIETSAVAAECRWFHPVAGIK